MNRWLVIAAYRCEVAGTPSDSLDFRVRYFELESSEQVEGFLRAEPPQTYLNGDGESVSWPLSRILSIEEFSANENGDEIIGFIAQAAEMPSWSDPSA